MHLIAPVKPNDLLLTGVIVYASQAGPRPKVAVYIAMNSVSSTVRSRGKTLVKKPELINSDAYL
jgi:hypothetical protein